MRYIAEKIELILIYDQDAVPHPTSCEVFLCLCIFVILILTMSALKETLEERN